jgi:predicted unusual protein kinase regulating ubiquinone biosynthesis (AarF/ABC1/UbiB family)
MDWMTGIHLSEFTKKNTDVDDANKIGQALWDFYMFQMHVLRRVHADPHPGNFLVDADTNLIAIDFGCVKEVPEEFYVPYFEIANPKNLDNPELFLEKMYALEILKATDTPEEIKFFTELFHEMLSLFTRPFHGEAFDFSDSKFFGEIASLGEKFAKNTELRKMNGNRGSKHFLYINRTFFGLYNLLNDLGASVDINNYKKYI